MDQMELEDNKPVPTGAEMSGTSTESGSKDDQGTAIKKESSNIRRPSILSSTSPSSYPFATSATSTSSSLSGLCTPIRSSSFTLSSSSSNSSSRGLFGAKTPIIKPASFPGTSINIKKEAQVFGTSFSSTNASSAMNTFGTSSISTSVANSTSPTGDTQNWFSSPSTSAAFNSGALNPRTSATASGSEESPASRIESAAFTMHRSTPPTTDKNTGKMEWSSSRKNLCPTHISKRQEMKHMMKGKNFKKLHHQIHSLRSYLTSGVATTDQVSDCRGIANNQNDILPAVEVVTVPRGGNDIQIQMRKLLKRKLRQRRNLERRLMQKVLINTDSAMTLNHDLLDINVNKNNITPDLSASDANSVASSTSSLTDIDDADVCFLKSILPDMKTLNDGRKLQFKSHVMSKLMDLISEQKLDVGQSGSSEQKWPQGPSTSQQVFSLDIKPIVPSQDTFP